LEIILQFCEAGNRASNKPGGDIERHFDQLNTDLFRSRVPQLCSSRT